MFELVLAEWPILDGYTEAAINDDAVGIFHGRVLFLSTTMSYLGNPGEYTIYWQTALTAERDVFEQVSNDKKRRS